MLVKCDNNLALVVARKILLQLSQSYCEISIERQGVVNFKQEMEMQQKPREGKGVDVANKTMRKRHRFSFNETVCFVCVRTYYALQTV